MAVRLHMNLGFVAEPQRLPDSADAVVVVEPTIGATTRTKGSLYLLVTGTGGRRLREATRLVASRIRDDYYYDLSAGISVCLRKAVQAANNVLLHSTERPPVGPGEHGPIGLALAVVRGNELYVATLGPAEAYLMRQARLLTLPDADPESGIPLEDFDGPEVWHGEITAGDCLILMSPNVTRRIGLGPIQDAVLQLHPQAAVDQIHRQFGSSSLGSVGGDGVLFIEATEVASTHKTAPLKPVWPGDSMAGAPERSPIPLADSVVEGVATMQTTAKQAQTTADGWLRHGVYNLFDRMPQRPASRGRVTPLTVRRERQQRAAVAVIGLLAVIAIIGSSMWVLSGVTHSDDSDRQQTAEQAYAQANRDLDLVYGAERDRNLMSNDPELAFRYLKDAYNQLQIAHQNGYTAAQLSESLNLVLTGLNQYYDVTTVQPRLVHSFQTDDLAALVVGPDGAAYVLDTTVNKVYRVDLKTGAALPVVSAGQEPRQGGLIVGSPRLLTTGGPDVVILDNYNNLWRWIPAPSSSTGRGSLVPINIPDNATWGVGTRAIGTFLFNKLTGAYNVYLVLPSRNNVLSYAPSLDGSSYPIAGRIEYLKVPRDVRNVDDMYVDTHVFLVNNGKIDQYMLGQAIRGWYPDAPTDTLIRPQAPSYTKLTSDYPGPDGTDKGNFYAYDNPNRRIVAFKKIDGTITGQYIMPFGQPWFSALTGMFVTTGPDGSTPTLYWIESGSLMSAALNPSTGPSASGSARPAATPTRS